MKKIFTISLLSVSLYASASGPIIKIKKKPNITVVCSTTISIGSNTLTITETAGNWFTGSEKAAARCTKKLARKLIRISTGF